MDLVGGILLGALSPVCCLAQYVVWPSMLFCTACCWATCLGLFFSWTKYPWSLARLIGLIHLRFQISHDIGKTIRNIVIFL